jgi:hypothetical protein
MLFVVSTSLMLKQHFGLDREFRRVAKLSNRGSVRGLFAFNATAKNSRGYHYLFWRIASPSIIFWMVLHQMIAQTPD